MSPEKPAQIPRPLYDMGESIKHIMGGGYPGAAVILIFSYLDSLASLSMPESREKATRADFIKWVDKYMKTDPQQAYQYSGKDVYAARCGIIHQYSPYSDYGDKEKCRLFVYSTLEDHKYDPTVDSGLVVISLPRLANDFFKAISRFLCELLSNRPLQDLVTARMSMLYGSEIFNEHGPDEEEIQL